MKKLFSIIAICFMLVGCGSNGPNISNENLNTGKELLNYVDAFLDGVNDADYAAKEIQECIDDYTDIENNEDMAEIMTMSRVLAADFYSGEYENTEQLKIHRDFLAYALGLETKYGTEIEE